MAKKNTKSTNPEAGEKYDILSPLLGAVLGEMKELSKKKPDAVLNELKVKMVNKILLQIKELLSEEPTLEFIELLDDETLPTNSDAVFILSQFRAAMDHFQEKYKYAEPEIGEYSAFWHTE